VSLRTIRRIRSTAPTGIASGIARSRSGTVKATVRMMRGREKGKSITLRTPRAVLAPPSQVIASAVCVRVVGFIPL
jgi:hypothetical protein